MKRTLWILAAFALLVTATAGAQTTNVRANVPFNFIVNGSTFPAGEYSFKSVAVQEKTLAIQGVNSHNGVLTLSENAVRSLGPTSATKLVFHRYGDEYFLSEIWTAGSDIGRQLPESRREREAAMNSSMRHLALRAARQ